jgi:hypothetical protein
MRLFEGFTTLRVLTYSVSIPMTVSSGSPRNA